MITLRTLELRDKYQIAKLLNNKSIWDNLRNYVPYPYSENDAEEFIGFVNNNEQQQVFAIDYIKQLCGVIGLITN